VRLTRRNQLWVLIFLSAATASLQYTLQGALATDANVEAFPDVFWVADYAAWALRALVEAWVVVYVFTTHTHGKLQGLVLGLIEIALLALIALTLGPAFRAIGAGERMYDSLTHEGFWLWNYGIAAYTSVMMAAAGIAYRMQPEDKIVEVKIDEDAGRQKAIVKMLRLAGPKTINWLSEHFNVSESTITADVTENELIEVVGEKAQLTDF